VLNESFVKRFVKAMTIILNMRPAESNISRDEHIKQEGSDMTMGHINGINGRKYFMNMDIVKKIDKYQPPRLAKEREYSGIDEKFALSVIGNLA
jgi:hypothetical protein